MYNLTITPGGTNEAAPEWRNNIMEYNIDDEEWQDIGLMKVARHAHSMSIVGFDDFEAWCI